MQLTTWEQRVAKEFGGKDWTKLQQQPAEGLLRKIVYSAEDLVGGLVAPSRAKQDCAVYSGSKAKVASLQDVSALDAKALLQAVEDGIGRGEGQMMLRSETLRGLMNPELAKALAQHFAGKACKLWLQAASPLDFESDELGSILGVFSPQGPGGDDASAIAPLHLCFDPHAAVLRGVLPVEDLEAEMANIAVGLDLHRGAERWISSRPIFEAGGDAVSELAYIAATAMDWMSWAEAQKLSHAQAQALWASMRPRLSVGDDLWLDLCKFRALLGLEAMLAAHLGIQSQWLPASAETGTRYWSYLDPWNNLLRATTSTFSALLGGAAMVTVHPFDAIGRAPSPLGRRMASNTVALLQRESHLGEVLDPARGSYLVENESRSLAKKAWERWQETLALVTGGWIKQVSDGPLRDSIRRRDAQQRKDLDTGKKVLVGVNSFATRAEIPNTEPESDEAAESETTAGGFEGCGATAAILGSERLAQGFEELRSRLAARNRSEEPGLARRIGLLGLGPVSAFGAKRDFVRGIATLGAFACEIASAGDVSAKGSSEALEELLAAGDVNGIGALVICAGHEVLPEVWSELISRARDAGLSRIEWAGAPATVPEGLDFDGCVHRGSSRSELLLRWAGLATTTGSNQGELDE